jgi:hypothetical protein
MTEKNVLIPSHTVAQAESDELARFEGEGGREASPPGPMDVRLLNAVRKRERRAVNQAKEKKFTQ